MPKTKLDFLSRMPSIRKVWGNDLTNALESAAYLDDWEFIRELLSGVPEEDYDDLLGGLWSLIPNQQVEA